MKRVWHGTWYLRFGEGTKVGDVQIPFREARRWGATLLLPTKPAALVSVIGQELHARSKEPGLTVHEISAPETRQKILGTARATKFEVAQARVQVGFESLRAKLPRKPPHPVLGYPAKDLYWLHLFDTVAVGVATRRVGCPWEALDSTPSANIFRR